MDETIALRPATFHDADLLLEWRNDPSTRHASRNTALVQKDAHVAWLRESLSNPNRKLLIAHENGVDVGTVRADYANGEWQLSWTVAPGERGRGVAKRMVALLARQIVEPIRAEVRIGNIASVRIAEHAGMHYDRESGGILHYRRGALQ